MTLLLRLVLSFHLPCRRLILTSPFSSFYSHLCFASSLLHPSFFTLAPSVSVVSFVHLHPFPFQFPSPASISLLPPPTLFWEEMDPFTSFLVSFFFCFLPRFIWTLAPLQGFPLNLPIQLFLDDDKKDSFGRLMIVKSLNEGSQCYIRW